jgi:phage N-6-adenine-methyltransferase
MVSTVVFSRKSDEYITPQWLYDQLNKQYKFKLDPATTEDNVLGTEYYYSVADDGLSRSWRNVNTFVNPPYSNAAAWVEKAHDQFLINVQSNPKLVVVMLVASRTDSKWFHDIVIPAMTANYCRIEFIKGRLKFRNTAYSSPFPSMIVIFEKEGENE